MTFYSTATGEIINTVSIGSERARSSAISPDGMQYIAQGNGQSAPLPPGLYNADDGSLARLLPWPGAVYANMFAFSRNSPTLAGTYLDGNSLKVRVWQLP